MKLLTKEQEQAHYNETLKGGFVGGALGLGLGAGAVVLASQRYQFFRQLTLPLRAFLITSAGTFAGIVTADHYSRAYEKASNPKDREFQEREREKREAEVAGKSFTERALDFGKKERYKIVGASWVASMATAFALVNRNPYLSGQQKLVQARVYAQFLTLGVLVASAAFELSDRKNETGRYETVKIIDPTDPEHKRIIERQKEVEGDAGDELWKEMVKAEEERMKERESEAKKYKKPQKSSEGQKKGGDKKDEGGDDKKQESGSDKKEDSCNDKKKDSSNEKKQEGGNDKKQEKESSEKKDDSKDKKKS